MNELCVYVHTYIEAALVDTNIQKREKGENAASGEIIKGCGYKMLSGQRLAVKRCWPLS